MPENRTMFATDTIWIHREPGVDSAPEDGSPPSWLQNARLLAQWPCPAEALHSALEVALCDLAGERVPDGLFPWAAAGAAAHGLAGAHWAEMHLCHWHVSNGQVTLLPPSLPATEVLAQLWQELAEFVSTDGLTLVPNGPTQAWVTGDCLQNVPTAALNKVMGRPLSDFLPRSAQLKRLQNELQMWFYTHPALQGLQRPINSVWFCGTGALTPALQGVSKQIAWADGRQPATGERWLWASDTHATLWHIGGASLWQRAWRRFKPLTWPHVPHELD